MDDRENEGELEARDITTELLERTSDGGRRIRLTHVPTGVQVEGTSGQEPVYRRHRELVTELRRLVSTAHR